MHARQHYLILLVRLNGLPPKFHFAKTTAETLKSFKNLVDKLHQQLTDMRLILGELIFTELIIVEMHDFFKMPYYQIAF